MSVRECPFADGSEGAVADGSGLNDLILPYLTHLTRDLRPLSVHLLIAEASDQVIVHHSDGLHEGIANRGADELEVAAEEIFAETV